MTGTVSAEAADDYVETLRNENKWGGGYDLYVDHTSNVEQNTVGIGKLRP